MTSTINTMAGGQSESGHGSHSLYNLYGKSGEAAPQAILYACIVQYIMLPHSSAAIAVVCK